MQSLDGIVVCEPELSHLKSPVTVTLEVTLQLEVIFGYFRQFEQSEDRIFRISRRFRTRIFKLF